MWRISAGGASAGRLAAVGSAGRKETSPFSTDPVTLDVDAPFGQQPQSRHMSAQSPNGSSNEAEQGAESPKAADAIIQASKRIAAKVVPGRLTQALITPSSQASAPNSFDFMVAGEGSSPPVLSIFGSVQGSRPTHGREEEPLTPGQGRA
jgi:hypothetical protein